MHVHGIHLNPNLQLNQSLSPQQVAAEKRAAEVRRKLRLAASDAESISDEYVPGQQERGEQGGQQDEDETADNASQKEETPESEPEAGQISSWA
jgi:hypothetical protein